jgi:hypothetical protein
MSASAFDTYAAVKKLKEAGFTEQQAEAQTALLTDVIAGELATKHDIETVKHDRAVITGVKTQKFMQVSENTLKNKIFIEFNVFHPFNNRSIEAVRLDTENVRAELKRDIEALRADMKHDMKELELRLTIKLGAMLALAVGAVATLVKLL